MRIWFDKLFLCLSFERANCCMFVAQQWLLASIEKLKIGATKMMRKTCFRYTFVGWHDVAKEILTDTADSVFHMSARTEWTSIEQSWFCGLDCLNHIFWAEKIYIEEHQQSGVVSKSQTHPILSTRCVDSNLLVVELIIRPILSIY